MACHRLGASLVACRADHSGRSVDRPTVNRGAHPAPLAGLDSPRSVSRTLQIHSASPDLQHAVVAAEDARFYQHHGFDWHELQIAAEDDLEGDRTRGASTITQQIVKNLFFGTGRSILRKGAEFTLVPVAEFVLGKRRILEIYLNVVEWGPGIYGAESACRYYDGTAARNVGREQAARLAAILPAPLKRRPERMNNYSARILERMRQMGW